MTSFARYCSFSVNEESRVLHTYIYYREGYYESTAPVVVIQNNLRLFPPDITDDLNINAFLIVFGFFLLFEHRWC